jgi:hypothetical protein
MLSLVSSCPDGLTKDPLLHAVWRREVDFSDKGGPWGNGLRRAISYRAVTRTHISDTKHSSSQSLGCSCMLDKPYQVIDHEGYNDPLEASNYGTFSLAATTIHLMSRTWLETTACEYKAIYTIHFKEKGHLSAGVTSDAW